jgi:hypothetical protein
MTWRALFISLYLQDRDAAGGGLMGVGANDVAGGSGGVTLAGVAVGVAHAALLLLSISGLAVFR